VSLRDGAGHDTGRARGIQSLYPPRYLAYLLLESLLAATYTTPGNLMMVIVQKAPTQCTPMRLLASIRLP
jgi:hypothetical protein